MFYICHVENWLKNNSSKSKTTSTGEKKSRKSKEFRERINEINDNLDEYQISSELGGVACISLVTYLDSDAGKWSLDKLNKLNLNPISTNYAPVASDEEKKNLALSGTTWVITGTLSESRNHFKDLIEKHGGNVTGSISKKTTYLLAGQNPGSKIDKARTLNVTTLDEKKLRELISESQLVLDIETST